MQVIPVACLQDNYAYLIVAPGSTRALVVDPSEEEPVVRAAEKHGLTIAGILNTHHHWDHVGGNEALRKRYPGIPVYGHKSDKGRTPELTNELEHGDSFEAEGIAFRVMHIPGHTMGAIAYVTSDSVFTGDTMFAAGCGRLFEGTPQMMYESLNEKLGSLPDDTRVYFGHEYTASNLRFAAAVEPGNRDVADKAARVAKLRERGEPTTPSTIGEERKTNPFMRVTSPELIEHVRSDVGEDRSPARVLGAIREKKDAFK